MVPRPRNGLSLCAGAGGLDLGLMLAEPGFHTRCFVEWEEYPRQAIIAGQRAMTCNTCKFWHPLPGAHDQRGQCRRSPPTAEWAFASAGIAGWPITVNADWCGEWRDVGQPEKVNQP